MAGVSHDIQHRSMQKVQLMQNLHEHLLIIWNDFIFLLKQFESYHEALLITDINVFWGNWIIEQW